MSLTLHDDLPLLGCGGGGPTDHVAAACWLVRYQVPVHLSTAGETRPAHQLVCDLPDCLDEAIRHAEIVSPDGHDVVRLVDVDPDELGALLGLHLDAGWAA